MSCILVYEADQFQIYLNQNLLLAAQPHSYHNGNQLFCLLVKRKREREKESKGEIEKERKREREKERKRQREK